MSAASANAAIDDGWVLDEPTPEPAAAAAAPAASIDDGWSLDDGWCLDEPVEPAPPAPVLTLVADYADELEADIEVVAAADSAEDGWAISDAEAAFFAEGEALAARRAPSEDFSDLGATEPETGFFKRLFSRGR